MSVPLLFVLFVHLLSVPFVLDCIDEECSSNKTETAMHPEVMVLHFVYSC